MKPEKQILIAFFVLLSIVFIGTLGYMFIEQWSVLDSFYMTIITLTTVGFGEVKSLSGIGRLFTVGLIICGVATITYAITNASKLLIEGQFHRIIGRKKVEKEIKKLTNHYIICGYGRMGKIICKEFLKKRIPFVLIERSSEVLSTIEGDILVIEGDATDDEILKEARIEQAKGLVSVGSSDADNVYITLTASGLNPNIYIVARAGEEGSEAKLHRAGAHKVISPYTIGGIRIANAILRPAVFDFIELVTKSEHLELQMEEIPIKEGSNLADVTVAASKLRQSLDIIIVAIKRKNGHMEFNPSSKTLIGIGDKLITLGDRKHLAELESIAAGKIRQD